MSPEDLSRITGGTWTRLPEAGLVGGATIDSRTVEPGQVFIALVTDRADGHEFVGSALAAGAVAAITSRPVDGAPCLVVEDPLAALTAWAADVRDGFGGLVLGVVGSVGKTTAKEMLIHLLSGRHRVHASPRSFNNDLGVPLTLLGLQDDVDVAVIEMGANGPGDLDRLGTLVRPDHLFVTPIGAGHLEGFGDLDGVRRAKGEILAHLDPRGWLALPEDPALAAAWPWPGKSLTWGENDSDLKPWPTTLRMPGCTIETPAGEVSLELPALWSGALLSGLCGFCERIGLEPDPTACAGFTSSDGRLSCRLEDDLTWIDDAYNANPVSVRHALEILGRVRGRRLFVFGDMLELGPDAEALHREIGSLANGLVDRLVAVGPLARHALATFTGESRAYDDVDACEADSADWIGAGPATILVKGSRAVGLEILAGGRGAVVS